MTHSYQTGFWHFLLLLLTAGLFCFSAVAEEKILHFESVITINRDASLDVIEKITVQAEGKEIIHGIYRDLPAMRPTPYGGSGTLRLEVKNVLRGGRPIPFEIEHSYHHYDFERVYLGDKTAPIPPGTYAYELRYRVTNGLGRFSDHDELYWNVTGNSWLFPIDRITAEVRLPWGTLATRHSAYTGYRGAKEQDFTAETLNGGNRLRFETTRAFEAGEGLTFAVSWPKGIIDPPPQYAPDRETWMAWAGGGTLLLVWYLAALYYQRRRPFYRTPPVIPEDVAELSPAEMYYALHKKLDRWGKNRIFSAMLLILAANGALTITRKKRWQYILERSETEPESLSEDEQRTMKLLFWTSPRIVLGEMEAIAVRDSTSLRQAIWQFVSPPAQRWVVAYWSLFEQAENKWERVLFGKGKFFLWGGGVLTVATVILAVCFTPQEMGEMTFVHAGLAGLMILTLWLIEQAVKLWRRVSIGVSAYWPRAVFFTIMAGVFIAGLSPLFLTPMRQEIHLPTLLAALALIGMNLLFYRFLTAYTREGKVLKKRIEDFRATLIAEAQREAMTPERFIRYYPYAIALGVEKPWDKALTTALNLSGAENYPPPLFSNAFWLMVMTSGMASTLSGLNSTISFSVGYVGGSGGSGLGGGGFSGGGAGGGGGGGF